VPADDGAPWQVEPAAASIPIGALAALLLHVARRNLARGEANTPNADVAYVLEDLMRGEVVR
jgi:hypothetical protein